MEDMLLNAHHAMKLFEETALMLWDLSGILNILLVPTARSPFLEEVSSNSVESLIVRLITINKLVHSVLAVENQSLGDVLMLWTRNGIQNILYVPFA